MQTSELVEKVMGTLEQVIDHCEQGGRNELLTELSCQVDRIQTRYTVVCALRDALAPDDELQIEEVPPIDLKPTGSLESSLEDRVIQYISDNGPRTSSEIADALGSHYTTIGRLVNSSSALAKDGKLVVLKLS